MHQTVTSADGSTIAYDRLGEGPTVIIVAGMFCDRERTRPLADHLASLLANHTIINYDRRGRGDSNNVLPYSVDREIDDLVALVAAAAGPASVYGHSSGAGLALRATAAGLPVERLILHEPPYGPDDKHSVASTEAMADTVRTAVEAGHYSDAIRCFMADSGLPGDVIEHMASDPRMIGLAATMVHDLEVMGDLDRGGTVPIELITAVTTPTLVISGDASPDFFADTATRVASLLPHGSLIVLPGVGHDAPADVVAPVIVEFILTDPETPRPVSTPPTCS